MSVIKTNLEQSLQSISQQHQEPAWFLQQRQAALKLISQLSWPVIPQFHFHDWPLIAPMDSQVSTSDVPKVVPVNLDNFIIQKGQSTGQVQLDPELQAQGVIVTDIFTALQTYPQLLRKYYFTSALRPDEDKLISYNCALMNNGIFIYIPENVHLSETITVKIIQDNTFKEPLVHHLLLVAGSRSQVSVMTQLSSQGDQTNVANCVVEIIAQEYSRVHFAAIDELAMNTRAYLNRRAVVADQAQVEWSIGMMNDGPTIGDFASELNGRESQSDAQVIAISTGQQRVGVNTRVVNRGQQTVGNIVQRGILLDQSQLTFNGIGHIIHGAHGANAEQENRVLMLSDQARGDANPILLIDENDVLAGHAASIGQVDQEQMYYLMSRGIDAQTAQNLVIRGFLGPVIAGMPNNQMRQQLIATVERKLIHG